MDLEQIIQRLEWFDEQRRKDKAQIAELQNRLANYEGQQKVLEGRIRELEEALSSLKNIAPRINQFDQALENQRADILKMFDERDRRITRRDQEAEQRWQSKIDELNLRIAENARLHDVIAELQVQIAALDEAGQRLRRDLNRLGDKFPPIEENLGDLRRAQNVLDENRRQDLKRIADLQGEIAAVRRRVEEIRDKIELASDTTKLLDTRINNLLSAEDERRRNQMDFIESQSRRQAEQERSWKEMQARFQSFAEQVSTLDTQLVAINETHRQVKQALQKFEDINQRLERRITEVTEMQRLAEDRMRQEWVAFKADDQKRWTSHTLSTDSQFKELKAQIEKEAERITSLLDELQTLRDLFEQTGDTAQAQLQALMNWTHQWLEALKEING